MSENQLYIIEISDNGESKNVIRTDTFEALVREFNSITLAGYDLKNRVEITLEPAGDDWLSLDVTFTGGDMGYQEAFREWIEADLIRFAMAFQHSIKRDFRSRFTVMLAAHV